MVILGHMCQFMRKNRHYLLRWKRLQNTFGEHNPAISKAATSMRSSLSQHATIIANQEFGDRRDAKSGANLIFRRVQPCILLGTHLGRSQEQLQLDVFRDPIQRLKDQGIRCSQDFANTALCFANIPATLGTLGSLHLLLGIDQQNGAWQNKACDQAEFAASWPSWPDMAGEGGHRGARPEIDKKKCGKLGCGFKISWFHHISPAKFWNVTHKYCRIPWLDNVALNCSWTASFEALSPDKDGNSLLRGFMGHGSKPWYPTPKWLANGCSSSLWYRPHWESHFQGLNMCLSPLTRIIHDLATERVGSRQNRQTTAGFTMSRWEEWPTWDNFGFPQLPPLKKAPL